MFWNPERKSFVPQDKLSAGAGALSLKEVEDYLEDAKEKVKQVLGTDKSKKVQGFVDSGSEDSSDEEDEEEDPPRVGFCCRSNQSERQYLTPSTQRLTWKVLLWGTRFLQLAWGFQGVVIAGTELDYWRLDYSRVVKEKEGEGEHAAERRLQQEANEAWRFQVVETHWPRGALFRPEGPLSCLSDSAIKEERNTHGSSQVALLVGSAHGVHMVKAEVSSPSEPLELQPLPKLAFPPGVTTLCGPVAQKQDQDTGKNCLLATLRSQNVLALWPFGSDESASASSYRIELPSGRSEWQLVSGAAVKCDTVDSMLVGDDSQEQEEHSAREGRRRLEWCLLLAGWDGGSSLSMAAVPVQGGLGTLPALDTVIVPVFELPLHETSPISKIADATASCSAVDGISAGASCRGRAPTISALHMESETRRGRVWALLSDHRLMAWETTNPPRSLGQWQLRWPVVGEEVDALVSDAAGFRATGLCELSKGHGNATKIMVVGRSGFGQGSSA